MPVPITFDHIAPGDRLLFALDDMPSTRRGPKVQGADIHHNPLLVPAGSRFLHSHSRVVVNWVVHPLIEELGLAAVGLGGAEHAVPDLPAIDLDAGLDGWLVEVRGGGHPIWAWGSS